MYRKTHSTHSIMFCTQILQNMRSLFVFVWWSSIVDLQFARIIRFWPPNWHYNKKQTFESVLMFTCDYNCKLRI